MSNSDRVRAFIARWEAQDIEGILDAFSDHPCYHNMPMDPLTSREGIRGFIEPFLAQVTEVRWDLHFIAEDSSGVVLTERLDNFIFGERKISLPVMGTFEFVDGKLSRWRDYFDLRDFEQQMTELHRE